jgi:hypothetical protein
MMPEDIVNNALEVIGHEQRIGSFWDGTFEAVVARDMWIQLRDAQLSALQPDWSRWDDALTPSKTAPPAYSDARKWSSATDPDMPWLYEYALPDDCLVPMAIKHRPSTLPVWRPRPMRFRIKTEAGVYTLLGNDPAPVLTCVHSVADTTVWHNDFIDAMTEALAKRLAPLFGQKMAKPRETEDANNPG